MTDILVRVPRSEEEHFWHEPKDWPTGYIEWWHMGRTPTHFIRGDRIYFALHEDVVAFASRSTVYLRDSNQAKGPAILWPAVDFVIRGTGKVSAVKVNGQKNGPFASCVLGRMPTFPKFNGVKTIASWSMSMR